MKTLSIRQPWAWAICNAGKDIENRNWYTNYRGPILIHASKSIDKTGYEFLETRNIIPPLANVIDRGGIVGYAEIINCVTSSLSPWFFGKYGFVLKNQKQLQFCKCMGQLRFFNVNYL
jgi:hypothetical protein